MAPIITAGRQGWKGQVSVSWVIGAACSQSQVPPLGPGPGQKHSGWEVRMPGGFPARVSRPTSQKRSAAPCGGASGRPECRPSHTQPFSTLAMRPTASQASGGHRPSGNLTPFLRHRKNAQKNALGCQRLREGEAEPRGHSGQGSPCVERQCWTHIAVWSS